MILLILIKNFYPIFSYLKLLFILERNIKLVYSNTFSPFFCINLISTELSNSINLLYQIISLHKNIFLLLFLRSKEILNISLFTIKNDINNNNFDKNNHFDNNNRFDNKTY